MIVYYVYFPVPPPRIGWEERVGELLAKEGHLGVYLIPRFTQAIFGENPSIIYVSNAVCLPYAMKIKEATKAPLICNFLDVPLELYPERKPEWDLIKSLIPECDGFTAISEWTKQQVVDWLGYEPDPFKVNYLGCDTEIIDKVPDQTKLHQVIVIARPVFYKRIDLVRSICEKLGVKFIAVTGFLPPEDLVIKLKQSRVLVQASTYISYLPMCEALYCQIPVIVYDIPVHREVLEDKATYFKTEDVLSFQIQEHLEDPRMGDKQYILKRGLTLKDSARRLSKILAEVQK